MSQGANTEIDFLTRIGNLEEVCFGGPNPTGAFPIVAGALGVNPVVAISKNLAFPFGSFGTAITLIPAAGPAGLYQASIYAVVTTTITTATSWLFKLGFTDDDEAQTPTICTSSTMTAGTAQQGTYTFRSTGVAAITFTPTAASAAAGAIAYQLVLEQLAV